MDQSPRVCTLSSATVLLGALSAALVPAAHAQNRDPELEEVVIVGSRAAPRTAMDSSAPVDVFSASDFQDQGTSDINDLMRNLVPTFNVQTQDINDGSSLVRPTTLRGLPADNTLVLGLTDQIPRNRANLRANHLMGDFRFTVQANYYDKYLVVPATADPSRDYWAKSAVIASAEIAYTWRDNYTFIIGADNVGNTSPERVRDIDFTSATSNRYLTSSGFGPNGRFLYGRLQVSL